MTTASERLKAKLEEAGIPAREIKVMGRTILITTAGETSAKKWAELLGCFATVQAIAEGYDEPKDDRSVNNPKLIHVWRVLAQVG